MKNLISTALLSRVSRVAWGIFLALGTVASSYGQLTGYTAELDTMLWETEAGDPLEGLAYYGVYKVYANLTSPEDVVSAVYSDMEALGTPEMGIDAPCGCANAANTSVSVDASNNPAFFSAFPEYEYDSFWTIGVETSEDPGQLPSSIGMGMPTDLCAGTNIVNGTIYITGTEGDWPVNALAGEDLKVLIARVTTCSDFTLQACTQVFVGGSQDSVQQICPEPLLVLHQGCTEEGACNYNPNATTDDDSCVFDDGVYGCDGECFNDEDGDGICDENEIAGCTGKGACNYNPDATDDDESCFYPGDSCDDTFDLTVGDVIQDNCTCQGYSCYDETACNFSTEGIEDNTVCSYITQYEISGNADPYSQTLQVYTYTNTAGSSYEWTVIGGDILEGNGTNEISIVWNVGGPGSVCVTETNSEGCSGDEVCFIVDVNLSSVNEMLDGTLEVFPVPAVDNLHVIWTGPTLDNAFVTLRDAAGRVVQLQQVGERDVVDVSGLSAGSYVMEFTVPARGSIQRRIVIQ
ncbi:MAG: T9SS type A sorting domain-containing protein [Flavobacteriales bacterium]